VHNPYLIGQAIYLRPVDTADAGAIVTWFNDPEVTRTLRRYRPLTLTEELAFIERMAKNETDFWLAIALREEDKFVGVTGLHNLDARHRSITFGIAIGEKAAWGKGYGTEATRLMVGFAFQTLNLNRVSLDVYAFNERAQRCYEKAGFRVEGRQRQSHFAEGRYWDTIIMGLLREEWQPK
jgi:[ribosomal protein S5]-alanine N-acetyltransferase